MSEANKMIAAIVMWVFIIWGVQVSGMAAVGLGVGLTYLMLLHKS